MGKFFNDFMMGSGEAANSWLKDQNTVDAKKQAELDKMNEILQSDQMKEAMSVQKDQQMKKSRLDELDQFAKQQSDNGSPVSDKDIQRAKMGIITGSTLATQLAKGDTNLQYYFDTNTNKQVRLSPNEYEKAKVDEPDRYLAGQGPMKNVSDKLMKDTQDNVAFLKDLNLLQLTLKDPKDLSDKEKDVLSQNGLDNYHDIAPYALNIATGIMPASVAATVDPEGAPLRSLIERINNNPRHALFMSRLTTNEVNIWNHAFQSNGFPGSQAFDKGSQIIEQNLQPLVAKEVSTLESKGVPPSMVARNLGLSYNPSDRDSDNMGYNLAYDSPNFNPQGVSTYNRKAPVSSQPTNSASSFIDPYTQNNTSPSASDSATSLMQPSAPPAQPSGMSKPYTPDPLTSTYMQPNMISPAGQGAGVPGSSPEDLAKAYHSLPPEQQNGTIGKSIKTQLQSVLKLKNSPTQ